jgi:hypothetical protein
MATTTACIDAPHHDAARDTARFLDELRTIVGRRHVLTRPERSAVTVRASDSERGRRWPSFGQATSSSSGEC